jgi:hypothetical protein
MLPDLPAAPGPIARQRALADRAARLPASGAFYTLFQLAFGTGAGQDALEAALDAADAYLAELEKARAKLRAGPPTATAVPVAQEDRRLETSPPPGGEVTSTVAHGGGPGVAR